MITVKKTIIKILTKALKSVSASLTKEIQEKYRSTLLKHQDKNLPVKLKDRFYKCGGCGHILEIAKLEWKYSKTGRYATCPNCKIKIQRMTHPDGYDSKKNAPYVKPEGATFKKPDITVSDEKK